MNVHAISTRVCVPLLLCLAGVQPSVAQPARPGPAKPPQEIPFADPSFWMDQFLGKESEADREALQRVPITPGEEAEFGERAYRAFQAELANNKIAVVQRGKDVAYLRRLVALVQPRMRHHARYPNIRVFLADSPAPEAKCFPGGTLVFFQGMLEQAESEAALVGVIGHELSHLDHGHQLHLVRRMKLAQGTLGAKRPGADRFFQSGTLLMRAFLRPFRPEDEAAADRDGVTWAYAKGYDPREMATLFLKFHQREPDFRGMLPSFLRTHPYALDRHQAVMKRYDELQAESPAVRLYVGKENLARRIPRSTRTFPE